MSSSVMSGRAFSTPEACGGDKIAGNFRVECSVQKLEWRSYGARLV